MNPCAAHLSNMEVHALLRESSGDSGASDGEPPSPVKLHHDRSREKLLTIIHATMEYLDSTPCSVQDSASVTECLRRLAKHDLTKGEKLQIINHRPSAEVVFNCLVEEAEDRFTDEHVEDILAIVDQCLPEHHSQLCEGEDEVVGGEGAGMDAEYDYGVDEGDEVYENAAPLEQDEFVNEQDAVESADEAD